VSSDDRGRIRPASFSTAVSPQLYVVLTLDATEENADTMGGVVPVGTASGMPFPSFVDAAPATPNVAPQLA